MDYSHKLRCILVHVQVLNPGRKINCCFVLSFRADRPCLEDRGRVQRVQRSVELGLTHILHRDNQDALMHKVHTLINLFIVKRQKQKRKDIILDVHVLHCTVENGRLNVSVSSLQLYQRMAVLRSLCSLHMEKLRWFSQRYPLTAHSLFPPLYKELFASEAELLPANAHWRFTRICKDKHKHIILSLIITSSQNLFF